MSALETVGHDNQSYRRGLILGLTLAEVMLLLIFALLIALTAVWNRQQKKIANLEAQITQSHEAAATRDITIIVDQLASASDDQLTQAAQAVQDIIGGQKVRALTNNESRFIDAARSSMTGEPPVKIDDNWTSLTTTAQNIQAAKWFATPNQRIAWAVDRKIMPAPAQSRASGHNWPPIIRLREAKGYFFKSGSAELPQIFESQLSSLIVPQLVGIAKQYDVDVIEVIGHTDEQPVSLRTSNLDQSMVPVLAGTTSITQMVPSDNAGLGLARAVSVVSALRSDPRLSAYRILPLSAGELIDTGDNITKGGGGDVKEQRRIEIRMRRFQSE